jgi:hypothetical protein
VNGEPQNPAVVALEQIREDIRDIKRQLEGDPVSRYTGLWSRLERDEKRIEALEEAWEKEQVDKRVGKAYRIGMIAGLSAVGITSGGALVGVIRVLQMLAGGGP